MENTINAGTAQPLQKRRFLTVLCILTFTGSGFGLLINILNLLGADPLPAKETTTTGTILDLLGCLFCLAGAIRMWSLHKDGFWIYVSGIVLSLTCFWPVIHRALHRQPAVNMGFWAGVVLVSYIYIMFVILYGMNKKYLVR